jgi:hypothetical protein
MTTTTASIPAPRTPTNDTAPAALTEQGHLDDEIKHPDLVDAFRALAPRKA